MAQRGRRKARKMCSETRGRKHFKKQGVISSVAK